MAVDLVIALLNTRVMSRTGPTDRDELVRPADLGRWWHEQRPDEDGELAATEHDLQLARTVREGLRAMAAANNDAGTGGDADALTSLEQVLPLLPLRASTGGSIVVTDTTRPATAALTAVVAEATLARAAGIWPRLKVCRDPLCRYGFFDATKNRSRTWCAMAICGTRAKQRAFTERHR